MLRKRYGWNIIKNTEDANIIEEPKLANKEPNEKPIALLSGGEILLMIM